jgi:hypothetical protein
MRKALAWAKPTISREAAKGRAEGPVVPAGEMVAGLGAAAIGCSEWAELSYVAGIARSGVGLPQRELHAERAYDRSRKAHIRPEPWCCALWRCQGAACGEAALGGPRYRRGMGAVTGRDCTA